MFKEIKIKNSPNRRKMHETGHYSINRSNRIEEVDDNFSDVSSNMSKSHINSDVESNYKEENKYLRDQLIELMDKNGKMNVKANRAEYIINKYNQMMVQTKAEVNKKNEDSVRDNGFKKNKKSTILLVEETEK
jgi:hypothetical protein